MDKWSEKSKSNWLLVSTHHTVIVHMIYVNECGNTHKHIMSPFTSSSSRSHPKQVDIQIFHKGNRKRGRHEIYYSFQFIIPLSIHHPFQLCFVYMHSKSSFSIVVVSYHSSWTWFDYIHDTQQTLLANTPNDKQLYWTDRETDNTANLFFKWK